MVCVAHVFNILFQIANFSAQVALCSQIANFSAEVALCSVDHLSYFVSNFVSALLVAFHFICKLFQTMHFPLFEILSFISNENISRRRKEIAIFFFFLCPEIFFTVKLAVSSTPSVG